MDIYAKRGTKVVFKHPNNGYDHDQERAREYLKVGATYTVEGTEVHSCHTDVYLREFPEVPFNSALFE